MQRGGTITRPGVTTKARGDETADSYLLLKALKEGLLERKKNDSASRPGERPLCLIHLLFGLTQTL